MKAYVILLGFFLLISCKNGENRPMSIEFKISETISQFNGFELRPIDFCNCRYQDSYGEKKYGWTFSFGYSITKRKAKYSDVTIEFKFYNENDDLIAKDRFTENKIFSGDFGIYYSILDFSPPPYFVRVEAEIISTKIL